MKISKKIISLFLTAVIVPCAVSTVSFQVSADEDKFEISKSSMTIGAGETYKLNTNTEKSVLWGTSNTTVVSPSKGNITGKKSGKATVVAKRSDGKLAKCSVSVKEAPYEIYLNKTSITLGVGETYDLNSSLPSGCGAHSIVYTTDDSTVATVKSAGGLVTAKAEGTAIITAIAYNGVAVNCNVNVVKKTENKPNVSQNKVSTSTSTNYTDDDLFCLAAVIWQEAGANYCSDNMQLMVANVVMNHVKSPNYPDTVREVITRKGAYGTMYWDGVSLPNATDSVTKAAIDRCYKNAKKILDGYRILPDNVIYQAGFVQGSGIYACEGGIYFCYA